MTAEERLERKREYNRAYTREWSKKNPERKAKANREWSATNREKMAAYRRAWVERNPEFARETWRRWRKAHPDAVNSFTQRRRARIRGVGGEYTEAEWLALCARYGNKCLACGSTERLTVDHVIPVLWGGRNVIPNIQPLCLRCNSAKGARIIDYRPEFSVCPPRN